MDSLSICVSIVCVCVDPSIHPSVDQLLTELLKESPVDTQAAAAAIGAYLQSPKLPESAVLAEFMEPFMNSLTADNATSMAKQIVENVAGTEAFETVSLCRHGTARTHTPGHQSPWMT